jgi:hypothetical protein
VPDCFSSVGCRDPVEAGRAVFAALWRFTLVGDEDIILDAAGTGGFLGFISPFAIIKSVYFWLSICISSSVNPEIVHFPIALKDCTEA